jgi:hypothetical protein
MTVAGKLIEQSRFRDLLQAAARTGGARRSNSINAARTFNANPAPAHPKWGMTLIHSFHQSFPGLTAAPPKTIAAAPFSSHVMIAT